jgi:protein-S-isoprenylcysteine O-methyltransferase Ste14
MNKFNLSEMKKKGASGVDSKINYLVGALIVIVLAVALAPEMFSGVSELENETNTPGWVPTVLYVIIGAGIVFLIWRAFGNSK